MARVRSSAFLLYESAYAELVFLPIMWPDFTPQTLQEALAIYAQKERRFGRTPEQVQTEPLIGLSSRGFDPLDRIS